MTLGVTWALDWMRRTAALVVAHREELSELDRQIGDGDHGENLARGFTAVITKLDEQPTPLQHVGEVLRIAATTLMSTVGGASGPLYGTAFLRASRATARTELDAEGMVALLEACLEGVRDRGGAALGDKTMADAWFPAAEAAAQSAEHGATPVEVLRAATLAARRGVEATAQLAAVRGRASFLGDLSIGVADPGAASTALVIEAAHDAAVAAVSRAA